MLQKQIAFAIVCTLTSAGSAWADGTASFQSDVLPMLNERPQFTQFILESLRVEDGGIATRISDQAAPKLGGSRVGPYEFKALWRRAEGDIPVTLIVDTEIKFYDRAGKEIQDGRIRRAVRLRESFSAIEIEPAR